MLLAMLVFTKVKIIDSPTTTTTTTIIRWASYYLSC